MRKKKILQKIFALHLNIANRRTQFTLTMVQRDVDEYNVHSTSFLCCCTLLYVHVIIGLGEKNHYKR